MSGVDCKLLNTGDPNPTQKKKLKSNVMNPNFNSNPAELEMVYQDAWRVCHPDFNRPFSSPYDACQRLLPYHVVADYETEEDDRILVDSHTTPQMLSRCQQWDHNIAAKLAEFTATLDKQVLAFNIISSCKTEEMLMMEQLLLLQLQEEKQSLRMSAMVHAEQTLTPIRATSVYGSQGSNQYSLIAHQQVNQP